MTITEEQFNSEFAEDICVIGYTAGVPDTIFLLDTASEPAQELNKDMARALAVRLLLLAEELPDPARFLPRKHESLVCAPGKVGR